MATTYRINTSAIAQAIAGARAQPAAGKPAQTVVSQPPKIQLPAAVQEAIARVKPQANPDTVRGVVAQGMVLRDAANGQLGGVISDNWTWDQALNNHMTGQPRPYVMQRFAETQERLGKEGGDINWGRLDPLGVLTQDPKQLAARYAFAKDPKAAPLNAYEWKDEDALLYGAFDHDQLKAAVERIDQSFPGYSQTQAANGMIRPSQVVAQARRELYGDIAPDKFMQGMGFQSREAKGGAAAWIDEKPRTLPIGEAMWQSFKVGASGLVSGSKSVVADITGDAEMAAEARGARTAAQEDASQAMQGRNFAGKVLVSASQSAPMLLAGGVAGRLVGAAGEGYLAARGAKSLGAVLEAGTAAAKTIEKARTVGSLGSIGGTSFADQYGQLSLDPTLSGGQKVANAGLNAVVEVVTEMLPALEAAKVLKATTWREFLPEVATSFAKGSASESAGEFLAALPGPVIDRVTLGDKAGPVDEQAYVEGMALGPAAGALMHGAMRAPGIAADAANLAMRQAFPPGTQASAETLARRLLPGQPAAAPAPVTAPPTASPQPVTPGAVVEPTTPSPSPPPAAPPAAPVAPAGADPAATAPPAAATPAPAAPAAADGPVTDEARAEIRARADFEDQLATRQAETGQPMSPRERYALAQSTAEDWGVHPDAVMRPLGRGSVSGRVEPAARDGMDPGALPAGRATAGSDVPGGSPAAVSPSPGVAGGRADDVAPAAPAPAVPDQPVPADQHAVAVAQAQARVAAVGPRPAPTGRGASQTAKTARAKAVRKWRVDSTKAAADLEVARKAQADAKFEAVKDDPEATNRLLLETDPRTAPERFGIDPAIIPKRERRTAAQFLSDSGGLNTQAFQSQFGLDPAAAAGANRGSRVGRPLFRRNGEGLTPDEAREKLEQGGFLMREDDPNGGVRQNDQNMVLDIVEAAINGTDTPALYDGGESQAATEYHARIAEIENWQKQNQGDQDADAAPPAADDFSDVPFSKRAGGAVRAVAPSTWRGAESSAPAMAPANATRGADNAAPARNPAPPAPAPVREAEESPASGRSGLLTRVKPKFVDEGHQDTVVPIDIMRGDQLASMRVKLGPILNILSKRANQCASLLDCVRS